MTGFGGIARFVLSRARAHRPLLGAALLSVLLTTAVLATLTAYSGAIGDAALRHALRDSRNAADTALVVRADVPPDRRAAAGGAVADGAREVFDGLPVTLRALTRSGPYALPRSLQAPDARSGDPDLTHFAALDRTQIRVTQGRAPRAAGSGATEVAVPESAARALGLEAGARLTLSDRLGGPDVEIRVTGRYRPVDSAAPYWRLDDLRGRGVVEVAFTTYGPLLTDPAVLAGGRVSAGPSAWLASADFSAVTAARTDALREAVRDGGETLRGAAALGGSPEVSCALPAVLDRVERASLVSRSTLLIVAFQLALLAGCTLLLVARLLSAERAGETRLLRARGGSRGQVARLAALEALLLAGPAAACAPLLAGPLTGLLAGQGAPARIGLHLDTSVASVAGRGAVWLVAAGVALGCSAAVALPALTSAFTAGRARSLPGVVRAGADVGLLVVAGVAYLQLDRRPTGAVGGDRSGSLGVDPLLVVAPALALLAGTVLTLRLLPPAARLAERRAARGRGLPGALAGWQFSRRPARGAGPVLLLVLAVALGMLAIGQGSSWDRSQDDQADFRAGAPVRVMGTGESELGRTQAYAAVPHVEEVAPAVRTTLPMSAGRTATVLALDTAHAADTLLMRGDLAPGGAGPLLSALRPTGGAAGVRVPAGTERLRLTAALRGAGPGTTAEVRAILRDAYGTPYKPVFGQLTADGRTHALTLELGAAGTDPGPLTLTAFQLDLPQPTDRAERHRFVVGELTADGARLAFPAGWTFGASTTSTVSSPDASTTPTRPRLTSSAPLTVAYGTGFVPDGRFSEPAQLTVRMRVAQPAVPEITAVATDRFLSSAGARTGQRVDVTFAGSTVPVRIVKAVRALPTTPVGGAADGGALLVDLTAVNRVLEARYGEGVPPTEWWLRTAPGETAQVAAALRARPDADPSRVLVRDEIASQLRRDPFGAGPSAGFGAAAVAAAALTAVGFAVSAAGSLRERGAEFAVLRALGTSRRRLARVIVIEHGVLVGLGLLVGVVLGAALARAVVPLILLTSQATRPVPETLVQLPVGRVAVLLAAVAAVPLVVTGVLAARRAAPVTSLRDQGGE
ncbi:FtsX-like permease family protein [Streptomyces sp. DH24]|uniref:FtsX-like permease family protein n=1 Tax=Streptomyces sp. DH24 TaxID=3040123 RepID=UPI0024427565|nr:FtsX-like permease family protein [Streptomyces sp. DH24]MDG9716788.1 FtsX-like permease family protein [Streptomyces sp. DH24]